MLPARVPTILVIDDTEVVRKSAARCLRYRGYFVLEASSAEEALQLIAMSRLEVDLVLTDLVMPRVGGAELVSEIRKRLPNVAAAYMTAHIGLSSRCQIVPEAGTPILIKPFTPAALENRVREALTLSGWKEPSGSA
jgi:CheY-like chemotaxis protein